MIEQSCARDVELRVLVVARWKRTAGKCRFTSNEIVCVWKLLFCSVHRDLDTWRREQLSRMSASKIPMHRSSAGPGVDQSAEAGTTPAPVLKTWSSIKELHSRLRELGAPIYGTKDVFFRRLCEYEHIAARKEYKEMRRNELAVATEPVTPKILPGPIQPSEVEGQHHMVNHLPTARWCELCVMRRGKGDPHLRSDLREKGEQLSVIAFDFAFVKTTSAGRERENRNMLRLWLLWTLICISCNPFSFGKGGY